MKKKALFVVLAAAMLVAAACAGTPAATPQPQQEQATEVAPATAAGAAAETTTPKAAMTPQMPTNGTKAYQGLEIAVITAQLARDEFEALNAAQDDIFGMWGVAAETETAVLNAVCAAVSTPNATECEFEADYHTVESLVSRWAAFDEALSTGDTRGAIEQVALLEEARIQEATRLLGEVSDPQVRAVLQLMQATAAVNLRMAAEMYEMVSGEPYAFHVLDPNTNLDEYINGFVTPTPSQGDGAESGRDNDEGRAYPTATNGG